MKVNELIISSAGEAEHISLYPIQAPEGGGGDSDATAAFNILQNSEYLRNRRDRGQYVSVGDRYRWDKANRDKKRRFYMCYQDSPAFVEMMADPAISIDQIYPIATTGLLSSKWAEAMLTQLDMGGDKDAEIIIRGGVYNVRGTKGAQTTSQQMLRCNYSTRHVFRAETGEEVIFRLVDNYLTANGEAYMMMLDSPNVMLSDVIIDGNYQNQNGTIIGVGLNMTAGCVCENVTIRNCDVGIRANKNFNKVLNNSIIDCDVGIEAIAASTDGIFDSNYVVNCPTGVKIGGQNQVVRGNIVYKETYGAGEGAILVDSSANGIVLADNELHGGEMVIDPSAQSVIDGVPIPYFS